MSKQYNVHYATNINGDRFIVKVIQVVSNELMTILRNLEDFFDYIIIDVEECPVKVRYSYK